MLNLKGYVFTLLCRVINGLDGVCLDSRGRSLPEVLFWFRRRIFTPRITFESVHDLLPTVGRSAEIAICSCAITLVKQVPRYVDRAMQRNPR